MSNPSPIEDPWWRLNNLYYIKDKKGRKVLFKPNWAQLFLYTNMWFLTCILKARQLGMTTFIQLFMLDRCLFNDNQNAGIVAHTKEDAEAFFEDKIKFAYDNLPEDLKNALRATSDTKRHLKFANGSQIRVGTSLRSGTYQYVHVSEFGKMCAKYPDKAAEVITGTLNTVEAGQFIFIESTAEGPFGPFYDLCRQSEDFTQAVENGDQEFTAMDYRFFFFPWWKHPSYVLDEEVEIPDRLAKYFTELEKEGIKLTPRQKNWYVKKEKEQGDKMKQEYPATSAEAFEKTTELTIYGKQLREARKDRRITKVPLERSLPVNTFWDLGRNDCMAIWFHQDLGARHHFIYYMEGRLQDLTYYVDQLTELKREIGWFYGRHYLPHDAMVVDLSSVNGFDRRKILEHAGLRPTTVVPRTPDLNSAIELVRKVFSSCYFDEEGCKPGLKALHGYEWTYDEANQTTRKTPAHNWASNGADAFRQFAQGYRSNNATFRNQAAQATNDGRVDASRQVRIRQRHQRGSVFNPKTDHVV